MNHTPLRLLFAFLFATTAARADLPVNLRGVATLPAVGLKLPLPNDATALPLSPVETKTYQFQRGAETWTEDRYQALELWYATQHIAEWSFPQRDSRLIVGAVTIAPPIGFTESDISREQFTAYTNSPQASVAAADERLFQLWMQSFTGCKLGEPQSLPVGRTRLARLLRYPVAKSSKVNAWLMRFNRSAGGLSYLPDVWIAVVSIAKSAPAAAEEAAFVEKGILANLSPLGRFEGRESATEKLLREKGQKSVRQHPSRDAAHASIAAHKNWWAIDSEDYVLLSNGATSRKLAESLLEDLQQARTLYAAKLPGFADTADDVAVIRLFASGEEYDAYVGKDYAWSGGLYDGNRRELVIRPIASRSRDASYQRTLQTALHEGFHQYIHQATGVAQPAVWFNEGYATFFETLTFQNGKPVYDEDKSRFQILDRFLKVKPPQSIPLRTLVAMDYQGFYAGTDDDRAFTYALGWAFMYFLERGAPLVRNKPYENILSAYYAALKETGDRAAATAIAFQRVDMDALERDFRAFWTSTRDRSLAKRK